MKCFMCTSVSVMTFMTMWRERLSSLDLDLFLSIVLMEGRRNRVQIKMKEAQGFNGVGPHPGSS